MPHRTDAVVNAAQPEILSLGLVLAACLVAVYNDVRWRRIPNWLTGALAVTAVAIHAFGGLRSLLTTLIVMVAVTVLGTFVYSRHFLGGGDVKLAIAASGVLGYPTFLSFLLYTMLGGGVLAIVYLLLRRNFKQTASRLTLLAMGGSQALVPDKSRVMPYAFAFALGAIVLALAQTVAPFLRIPL